MPESFGRYLRSRREELGLTRQRVADESGLSYAYLTQLERGTKSRPSMTALNQLAQGLGVPVEELTSEAGVPSGTPARAASPRAVRTPRSDDATRWHANPAYGRGVAPASVPASGASAELATARAEVLPAMQRLLATYSPVTRLALLNDLQGQALAELHRD